MGKSTMQLDLEKLVIVYSVWISPFLHVSTTFTADLLQPCHPLTFKEGKKLYLKIKFQSAPPEEKKKTMSENNTLMETMSSDRNFTYVSSYYGVSYSPSSTFLTKVDAVIFILWLASKYTFMVKLTETLSVIMSNGSQIWLPSVTIYCP